MSMTGVGVAVSGARISATIRVGVLVGITVGAFVAGGRDGAGRVAVGVKVSVAVGGTGVAGAISGRASMHGALNHTRFSPPDPSVAIARMKIVTFDAAAGKNNVS